jgi:enoyl-CoA hydratase/carnithine racemase
MTDQTESGTTSGIGGTEVPSSAPPRPPTPGQGQEQGTAGLVRVERHGEGGHVAELVLDRPEAMNAVSTEMARALARATQALAEDPDVRSVVVSSSSPKAFCVGADLKERNTFTDEQLRAQRPVAQAAYRGVLDLPVPVVAAVDGYALGGGFEIALSCDLVVCGEAAVVGLPEVGVGVIPGGGGTQLLTRRVGWSRAARMIFTAQRFSADAACALGAVDEVVATGSARDRAMEIAAGIAANSPVGVRNAKRAMRLGFDTDLAAGLRIEDECWAATAFSGDRAEGVAAFNEKRRPNWPGR